MRSTRRSFPTGGGIGLEHCTITDDRLRCAIEYNCVRWGHRYSAAGGRRGVLAQEQWTARSSAHL